jgi:hypothetical protein
MKFLGTSYEREVREQLMSYLPSYYFGSKVVEELIRVDSVELENLYNEINKTLDQRFVDTADTSLPQWVKEFDIPDAKAVIKLTTETFTNDLSGKIGGSDIENPHFLKRNNGNTVIQPPTGIWGDSATSQYEQISKPDGSAVTSSLKGTGVMAQQMFGFNIVEAVERQFKWKIPGLTLLDKVNWCRANVNNINAELYAKAWCGTTYRASFNVFNKTTNTWTKEVVDTTNSFNTKINLIINNADMANCIHDNGFIYYNCVAPASDNVSDSVVQTDYVSIKLNVKWQRTEAYNRTVNELRALIKLRIRATSTITKGLLKEMVKIYGGGDIEIIEDFNNYDVTIKFLDVFGTPLRIEDLTIELRNLLPAHLGFKYQFRYRTWNDIDNSNMSWVTIDSKQFLWDNIDNGGFY